MPAGARAHQDQPVDASLDRLAGLAHGHDVVKHEPAPGMHERHDGTGGRQAGDDQRNTVARANLHILVEARIGGMDDLVHRVGRHQLSPGPRLVQFGGDAVQPARELRLRPRVECRKGAHDAGPALGDHEPGVGDDEERRADDRHRQVGEKRGHGHGRRSRCRETLRPVGRAIGRTSVNAPAAAAIPSKRHVLYHPPCRESGQMEPPRQNRRGQKRYHTADTRPRSCRALRPKTVPKPPTWSDQRLSKSYTAEASRLEKVVRG